MTASRSRTAAPAGAPPLDRAAYAKDLAALERAILQRAPDRDRLIQAFCTRHALRERLSELVDASALDPARTPALAGASEIGLHTRDFRVYGSLSTRYDLVRYHEDLGKLLPRVERGDLSLDDARRKAAPSFLTALFDSQHAMEIADLKHQQGVWVSQGSSYGRTNDHRIALFAVTDHRPDSFSVFRPSWRDMASRIVLGKDYQVASVDQREPEQGYATLLQTLRSVGALNGA